jgi:hypothetical protein
LVNRRSLLLCTAALFGPVGARAQDRSPGNAMVLRAPFGGDVPVRLGRPFVQGEIRGFPQAVLGGTRLATQADVKTRWPDGSVQHAILSFILPREASGSAVTVGFADADRTPGVALSRAAMLDPGFDFDATIRITRAGATQVASARRMLEAGDFTVWCAGPIATTIILADHSAARRWDIGPEPLRPLRPIFHATFWPQIKRVEVRAIGEIANTEALTDLVYDLEVTAGAAAPASIYRQSRVPHYAATRWGGRFWIGRPLPPVAIDHNLAYLAATRAFPNFDTSLRISEAGTARDAALWEAAPRQLYDAGLWTRYMPTTGGRPEIGPYPEWQVRWLHSGDTRQFALVEGMAELAGAWPLHVREGNPAKRFDAAGREPAIGLPVSVNARPSLWLLDDRDQSRPEDRVRVQGERLITNTYPKTGGGWVADGAHQPDPYSAAYTLTGDHFMLEQLQFWAAVQALSYNPDYKGPPASGAIFDQPRGCAWVMRNRVHAAFLSPDGSPEKAYFTRLVDDALAYWEGVHGITGTRFEGSAVWRFGRSKPFEPPLHEFSDQPVRGDTALNLDLVKSETPVWEDYFIIFELGHAKEKGFATGPLLSWLAVVLTGQFQDPRYDPANLIHYYHPVRDSSGAFYRHWSDMLPAFQQPLTLRSLHDVSDGYGSAAYGASTMITHEPGGDVAYAWLRGHVYEAERPLYAEHPKWAFLPRR